MSVNCGTREKKLKTCCCPKLWIDQILIDQRIGHCQLVCELGAKLFDGLLE